MKGQPFEESSGNNNEKDRFLKLLGIYTCVRVCARAHLRARMDDVRTRACGCVFAID